MYYYHSLNFDGELIFCDASEDTLTSELVAGAIKREQCLIKYRHSASGPWESVAECLDLSSSGFAALSCDDDFLVPTTIQKCIEFLTHNPSYSSVHGKAIIAESRSLQNRIDAAGNYRLPVRSESTGLLRLRKSGYEYGVNLFSVHPIHIFRRMCDGSAKFDPEFSCSDWELSQEILPNLLSAVYGKSFEFSDLYLVRQIHSQRYKTHKYVEWAASPGWRRSYTYVINHLAAAIVQVDGCVQSLAEDTAVTSLEGYISVFRRKSSCANVTRLKFISRIRYLLDVFGLRHIAASIRNMLFPKPIDERVTLDIILEPCHPYHHDFSRVLQSFVS